MTETEKREILSILNSLSLAELSRLEDELVRARDALVNFGQADLSDRVEDARRRLRGGNVAEFRRAIANVTARLGHVAAEGG